MNDPSDIPPFEWPDDFAPAPQKPAEPQRKVGGKDFPSVWVDDAEVKLDSRAFVKGLIDAGSFVLIYGPSGSGKSFFTADLSQHIATGQYWRGKKVEKGLVVYVAAEAGASILKRFVGWRENRMSESAERIPLAIVTRGPNLLNTVEVEALCDKLRELMAAVDLPLAMVVFDTLSRSIHGGDENKAEDMTMVVATADYLRDQFGCATTYVHHSGKDPSKGARGHSALWAAADVVICIEDRVGTLEKTRDGVSGEAFPFALDPVEIGTDIDGDPVMTCLLVPTENAGPVRRPEPTGKNQRIVLKEIRNLSPSGQTSPGSSVLPKGVLLVRFEDLADATVPKFAGMERAKARGRISEALSSLQASGFIGVHGEFVWLI